MEYRGIAQKNTTLHKNLIFVIQPIIMIAIVIIEISISIHPISV